MPEIVRSPSRGVSSESRAGVWALQWRKRWGAHHGRVRVREDISAAEMRAKVYSLNKIGKLRGFFRACFLAPFLGGFRAAFGLRVVERKQLSMCYRVRRGGLFAPAAGIRTGASCSRFFSGRVFLVHRPSRLGSGSIACRINFLQARRCCGLTWTKHRFACGRGKARVRCCFGSDGIHRVLSRSSEQTGAKGELV